MEGEKDSQWTMRSWGYFFSICLAANLQFWALHTQNIIKNSLKSNIIKHTTTKNLPMRPLTMTTRWVGSARSPGNSTLKSTLPLSSDSALRQPIQYFFSFFFFFFVRSLPPCPSSFTILGILLSSSTSMNSKRKRWKLSMRVC